MVDEYNPNLDTVIVPTLKTYTPFEADLRGRLYDIMEEWEERADTMTHPALQKEFRAMIDQIDDAMHPAEEN